MGSMFSMMGFWCLLITTVLDKHAIADPDLNDYDTARLALHGIEADMPLAESEDDDDFHILTQKEEFLTLYPRKDLKELNETEEDGVFTVVARVTGLAEGEKWWYSACSCHKAVTIEDGTFYCSGCRKPVLSVTLRLRLKVEVEDAFDCGTFVIFDTDCQLLLNKSCIELVMISKAKSPYEYSAEIETIIGRELLFKVEKSIGHGTKFDDSYKVKKICSEFAVIESFKDKSKVQTSSKMITKGKFPKSSGGTDDTIGDYYAKLSEIGPNVVSLDEISPGEGFVACSSVQSVGSDVSTTMPAKRMMLRSVKLEKE